MLPFEIQTAGRVVAFLDPRGIVINYPFSCRGGAILDAMAVARRNRALVTFYWGKALKVSVTARSSFQKIYDQTIAVSHGRSRATHVGP